MLAAGDGGGTLHILEVPWSLSHASNNEVNIQCTCTVEPRTCWDQSFAVRLSALQRFKCTCVNNNGEMKIWDLLCISIVSSSKRVLS